MNSRTSLNLSRPAFYSRSLLVPDICSIPIYQVCRTRRSVASSRFVTCWAASEYLHPTSRRNIHKAKPLSRPRRISLHCRSPAQGLDNSQLHSEPVEPQHQIVLWIPNLVTYTRLLVLCCCLALAHSSAFASYLGIGISFLLDGLDGLLARRLKQESQFGAFLDVAVDNFSRAAVLAAAMDGPWPIILITLEAVTFACTNAVAAGSWKETYFLGAPSWVRSVMANGFKTPLGCLAIGGLFGLPLWAYAWKFLPGTVFSNPLLGVFLLLGRIICISVELWVVGSYLGTLLNSDQKQYRLRA